MGKQPIEKIMRNTTSTSNSILLKRLDNIQASSDSRLEAAKANHNSALVSLIEQEKRQIEAVWLNDEPKSLGEMLKNVWQQLLNLFGESHELEVWTTTDMSHVWWHAHNHLTGQSVVTDSEDEMRIWIESHYGQN
jgi:hypothetical protein